MLFMQRQTFAVQWRDTKLVTLLSTAHNMNEMTEVSRTQKDGSKKKVACPKAIADYIRTRNSHLEVRLRIARRLIGGFCSGKQKLQSIWVATKKEIGIPQEIRTTNVGTHMPEKGQTYRR
ncbi:hypothetical protein CDAR_9641 [Caerostris darwini]|uniref:Uncharacterized protein n=1 Tax=Caerostris darwini TaxID=1538125 RepID=A0AAV4URF4_9ARAC|nr:hypothetical protein CDAR_9641 [Caerostris darwini]